MRAKLSKLFDNMMIGGLLVIGVMSVWDAFRIMGEVARVIH